MKTAIVYYSKHHGNTKKLVDAIAAKWSVTLIDAAAKSDEDLSAYDRIGFASGVYYSKLHKSVVKYLESGLPTGKKVFFLYTCGALKDSYTKSVKEAAAAKGCECLGEYGCLGFDSFGPFKLIGGIAKGHPNTEELQKAVEFYEGLR